MIRAREKPAATTKTAAMIRKITAAILEILAAVWTAATTGTITVVKTVVAVTGAPKVFRKKFIIMVKEEIATVAARAFWRGSAANFNKREKYIWINGNVAAFVWWGRETAAARAWGE